MPVTGAYSRHLAILMLSGMLCGWMSAWCAAQIQVPLGRESNRSGSVTFGVPVPSVDGDRPSFHWKSPVNGKPSSQVFQFFGSSAPGNNLPSVVPLPPVELPAPSAGLTSLPDPVQPVQIGPPIPWPTVPSSQRRRSDDTNTARGLHPASRPRSLVGFSGPPVAAAVTSQLHTQETGTAKTGTASANPLDQLTIPPRGNDPRSGIPQVELGAIIPDTDSRQSTSAAPVAIPQSKDGANRYESPVLEDLKAPPAGDGLDALPPSMLQAPSGQRSSNTTPESVDAGLALPDLEMSPSSQWPIQDPQQQSVVPESGPLTGSAADEHIRTDGYQGPPALKAPDYKGPFYLQGPDHQPPQVDRIARQVPYQVGAFTPQPIDSAPANPAVEASIYRGKFPVAVQRPLIELGRPLYTSGIYPPAKNWFGSYNPVMPHFMVYGDFRTAMGISRAGGSDNNNWASRLNLDMDLEITATERIHAFMGPLDRGGDFTRLDFTNDATFVNRTDMRFDTLFFEGDAGAIWGGLSGQDSTFDLPFTFGFLPVFYQNGIWANDNVMGAAFALPSKHNGPLRWSNYDATFFWASDQINSDAFPGDNNAAEFFGTAWFIDAYDGYIEADYAFVHDDSGQHLSYHNFSIAFTRRYFHRVSNSIRFITNFNQSLPRDQRTAEGHLILIENSLISAAPNTFVPYFNFFYGQGRTQSLARAGVAGGILNNTGINFETDGLTGYPTLDATAVNTTGAAIGLNMLGYNFNQQLILEFAALAANGSAQFRNAPGDQYAIGMRYQRPLNNFLIFRTDHMFGFLRGADDIRGSRVEMRWKF